MTFIDVGIGVQLIDDSLIGIVAVTTVTAEKSDHISKGRITFVSNENDADEKRKYYSSYD